jgi:hypothetical protein
MGTLVKFRCRDLAFAPRPLGVRLSACKRPPIGKRVPRFKFMPWQVLVAPRVLYVWRLCPLEFLCRA